MDVYAFYEDKGKYLLNDDLNDITSIKASIQTINGSIQTINGDISDITDDIQTINGDIQNVNDSIDGINASIQDINGNISDIADDIADIKDDYSQVGHEHDASDITTGVLPISHGGTSGSTARAARHALGLNFDSGDVISGTFYGAGYVTGGGTYFVFEIPLSKVVDGSLSLVSIETTIRQGGYYIFTEADVKSIATLSKVNGGIRVELRPNTMPEHTINNDVFGVVCVVRINII